MSSHVLSIQAHTCRMARTLITIRVLPGLLTGVGRARRDPQWKARASELALSRAEQARGERESAAQQADKNRVARLERVMTEHRRRFGCHVRGCKNTSDGPVAVPRPRWKSVGDESLDWDSPT